MVSMKIDLKGSGIDVNKSGFEPYEGPLPTPGAYAAIIRSCRVRISQAGNPYFNIQFEFADQTKAEKQKFKGYPLWDRVVPGESDIQKERVAKFLFTVSGKDPDKVNVVVDHDEVTDGGKVNKIGGKDPVGTRCKVVVLRSTNNGEPTVELRDLFPWPKDEDWPEGEFEDSDDSEIEDEEIEEEPEDEESEEEDEEEEDEEGDDFEARQEELSGLSRVDVKKILKELDPWFKVLKSHSDEDLVNAVLDLEYPPEEGEEDEEEEGDDEPPF